MTLCGGNTGAVGLLVLTSDLQARPSLIFLPLKGI